MDAEQLTAYRALAAEARARADAALPHYASPPTSYIGLRQLVATDIPAMATAIEALADEVRRLQRVARKADAALNLTRCWHLDMTSALYDAPRRAMMAYRDALAEYDREVQP